MSDELQSVHAVRWAFVALGFLILLVVAIVSPYFVLSHANLRTCRAVNGLRRDLVVTIDEQVVRGERSLKATMASPVTTHAQKKAAHDNLHDLHVQQRKYDSRFADHC